MTHRSTPTAGEMMLHAGVNAAAATGRAESAGCLLLVDTAGLAYRHLRSASLQRRPRLRGAAQFSLGRFFRIPTSFL